jgi:hypothetical protein
MIVYWAIQAKGIYLNLNLIYSNLGFNILSYFFKSVIMKREPIESCE